VWDSNSERIASGRELARPRNRCLGISWDSDSVSAAASSSFKIRGKRGLLSINAVKQLSEFHIFFQKYQTLFWDDLEIIEKSCEIHAKLKAKGTPIQDADILIAATAIVRDLILVSNDSDLDT
jgi:hypothetical protein